MAIQNRREIMFGRFSIAALLLTTLLSCNTEADDFYFGGYMNQVYRFRNIANSAVGGEADSIKQELGFNSLIAFAPDSATLRKLGSDKGFFTFPTMNLADDSLTREDWRKSWKAYYAEIQAEDNIEIGFQSTGTQRDGVIYGPTANPGRPVIFLDSLEFLVIRDKSLGSFNHKLFIRYDKCDNLAPNERVAYVVVHKTNGSRSYGYSLVDTFFVTADNLAESIELGSFAPPDNDRELYKVQIGTYQRCAFGVDYYRFYNEYGRNLVEKGDYLDNISRFAADHSNDGNVKYWYIQDEAHFGQWLPHRVINNSLRNHGASPGATTFSYIMGQGYPREFIGRAHPEVLLADIYPLKGGQVCQTTATKIKFRHANSPDSTSSEKTAKGKMTSYSGNDGDGLQYALDHEYIAFLDSLHAAASDSGVPLWVMPQAFGQAYKSYDNRIKDATSREADSVVTVTSRDCSDDWFIWRAPTQSELSAMTFTAMCYDIKGILYYRYDSFSNNDEFAGGFTDYTTNGSCKPSPLWDYIKNNITPYIKSYADIYTSEDFINNRAYTINDTNDPPPGAYLDMIVAVSNNPTPNPDLGWFHVGEFTEGDDKYVMIVNRACSRGADNPDPAPPVTATIDFKTMNLRMGNHVNIIDLAKTVNRDSSGEWVGIPDTTRACSILGKITYSTVLEPGEGRLFKIERRH